MSGVRGGTKSISAGTGCYASVRKVRLFISTLLVGILGDSFVLLVPRMS